MDGPIQSGGFTGGGVVHNETEKRISRRRALFSGSMAGLTLLLGLLISLQFGILDTERRQSEARSQATHDLATLRARLEGIINTVFSATSGLSEVIAYQGGITPALYEVLVRQVIKGHPQIRNIVAAPDNIITLVYPLEANRQALGVVYATIPEQYAAVQRAMQTGRPVFSGPHNLVQGGRGIIARVPIYTSVGVSPGATPRYWGVVSVVTDIDALLDAGGIRSSAALEVGLRKIDDQGNTGALIWGKEALFTLQPVVMEVSIPGGAWQIVAVPKGGWPQLTATVSMFFYIGLANSLLAAAFLGWLVAQPYRVRLRNQELRQQIADRLRAEEELRLSEQKYAAIFHLIPDMIGITRLADGCFLEVNEGFTRISGWEEQELLGRISIEMGLWTTEARAGAMAIVKEQGWLEKYEFLLGVKSGEKRNALMFLVPIKVRGEDCLFFIARDITELKQAQRVLENERARLRNLLQTIPALVWMKDPEGFYIFCNGRFERLLGALEPDIIGKTDHDFFPSELAEFFRANDRRAVAAGQSSFNEEWLTYADDGHRELVETINTPVLDVAGQFMGVLGVAWDITEKKRIEEELRRQRTRFVNLVDSVDGIVWKRMPKPLRSPMSANRLNDYWGIR
jgi:PAS domain S-box-containing protein